MAKPCFSLSPALDAWPWRSDHFDDAGNIRSRSTPASITARYRERVIARIVRTLPCSLVGCALIAACGAPTPSAALDEGELRAAAAGGHTIGTPGPAIALTTIDGETIDLAQIYGTRPVYLKFWATWCVPCREQMPGFERTYEALGQRMQVIAVNTGLDDDADSVRAFRAEHHLRMPIVIDDGRLAAALDLQVTPQHVVIDRSARIAYVGHHDGERLDRAIAQVLAEPGPGGPATGRPVLARPAFRPGDVVAGLKAHAADGSELVIGPSPTHRSRGLVLFSVWCEGYLKDSRPASSQACRRVREQVDRLVAAGGVDWLGIASGLWTSPDDVAAYRTNKDTRLAVVLDADGALFRAFGVRELPTVVLLDPDGRLVRLLSPGDRDLAGAVSALAAQR